MATVITGIKWLSAIEEMIMNGFVDAERYAVLLSACSFVHVFFRIGYA